MKLRYTTRAARELDRTLIYIAERSPSGARRVHTRIQAILAMLMRHSRSGPQTSSSRLRQITAVPYPYLIYYEVTDDEILIIGIRHAARDPASMPH